MLTRRDLTTHSWSDYELIDSGENKKLERFGKYTVIRPETQALWSPREPGRWKSTDAEFRWAGQKGSWHKEKSMPEEWELSYENARFHMRLTSFKHIGIFPEQAPNWEWIHASAAANPGARVLNLFGYTGIASIVAAQAGANVTHVDASKQSNAWAKDNAALSKIENGAIRFLLDDAMGFVLREGRRGTLYDGIILDPPAFGRGPKGEIWRIEEHLEKLLRAVSKIFSPNPGSFFILNGYAAGYSPISFMQAAQSSLPEAIGKSDGEFGELGISAGSEHGSVTNIIPSGIYLRSIRRAR